jgi:tetratricopeptide (TPR) repeat protein
MIKTKQLIQQAKQMARSGDFAQARLFFLEAWHHVEQEEDAMAKADVAHVIADHFCRNGLFDQAEIFARRAVEFEGQTGRTSLYANHLMFLAKFLDSAGRYPEALQYAEKALPYYVESLGESHPEVAYISSVVNNLRSKV